MASACVNNIGMSPAAKTYPPYGWLSPRMSFSREEDHRHHHPQSKPAAAPPPSSTEGSDAALDPAETQDPVDFEFRLDDPVTMLPADELFSDGKLVPLHINAPPPNVSTAPKPSSAVNGLTGATTTASPAARSPDQQQQLQQPNRSCRRMELEISGTDAYLFSPKAPRCSSRWKELLGLKKLYQNPSTTTQKPDKTTSSSSSSTTTHTATTTTNPKSLKHFLHRSSKPCSCSVSLDHTLSLPLLKDSDYLDSVSISSSRLSLSSSSSSHDHEDLPRLSLDASAEKPSSTTTTTPTATATHHPNPNPFVLNRAAAVASRVRMVKARSSSACESNNGGGAGRVGRSPMRREEAGESCSRGVSVDSPRMNSSGKIVFQSLERSSSSPSTFNGGPRLKHRGMERSYSANVRVTPVLNVPVCSLRGSSKSFGFGQLFSSSPQKREGINNNKGQHHHHHHHHHHQLQQQSNSSRNRTTDRT
ncbi:hypothetical protein Tsubulata_012436 [Turnera subulata]|uniref:Uncharacterized protein n=1 Tax=Turnera subulata TaxID=218843 RepID=A0A9Q0GN91_9ROSI|nr:hypothetical protein Tsubulata_012436 [Turnera subulata]